MAQERTGRTEERASAGRRVRAAKVACAVVAGAGMLVGAVAGLTVADALYPDGGARPTHGDDARVDRRDGQHRPAPPEQPHPSLPNR